MGSAKEEVNINITEFKQNCLLFSQVKQAVEENIKDVEDQKAAKKKAAERKDDIAMVIGIVAIMLITCTVVVVKVTVIDAKPDMNVSTFKPLTQQKNSNEKYTFVGYIPCNGYVPCKV